MADFETADRITQADEGGKAPDGARFGIDPVAHPGIHVSDLTPDAAQDIRYKEYWLPVKGPLITDQQIVNKIYDASVHHGPGEAVIVAQHAYNDLYPRQPLTVDGVMGMRSVLAINEIPPTHRQAYLNALIYERAKYMLEILAREPDKEPDRVGWLARI